MLFDHDPTLTEVFKEMQAWNAATYKVIAQDGDDRPLGALVFLRYDDPAANQEVLALIDQYHDRREAEFEKRKRQEEAKKKPKKKPKKKRPDLRPEDPMLFCEVDDGKFMWLGYYGWQDCTEAQTRVLERHQKHRQPVEDTETPEAAKAFRAFVVVGMYRKDWVW